MPFIAQSVFPIIKIMLTNLILITFISSNVSARKVILYLAIMINHAEDICRILHMAKVFPCLFPMGKTDNHNYSQNNDKITLFISLIH